MGQRFGLHTSRLLANWHLNLSGSRAHECDTTDHVTKKCVAIDGIVRVKRIYLIIIPFIFHLSGCLQKLSLFDGLCKNKKPLESPMIDLPAGLTATLSATFEPINKTPAFWYFCCFVIIIIVSIIIYLFNNSETNRKQYKLAVGL